MNVVFMPFFLFFFSPSGNVEPVMSTEGEGIKLTSDRKRTFFALFFFVIERAGYKRREAIT